MTRGTKTDNAFLFSKLALRRHLLKRHHSGGDIRVFDCCQGSGVIWKQLRKEFTVASYWGVDVKPKKGRLKIDSKRVVCQPGLNCNVIDIDTYGMPWDHWLGLLPNLVEPTTVFMTIGLVTMGGGGSLSNSGRRILEIPDDWPVPNAFTGGLLGIALHRFISMRGANGFRAVEAWESPEGPHARYIGVHVNK